MRRKILTIEETFKISGRGLILVGEFDSNSVKIKVGDPIIVIRPDGRELNLFIIGFELFTPIRDDSPRKILPLLVGDINKEEIPIGSQVFIEE